MATSIRSTVRENKGTLISRPLVFQRGDRTLPLRKSRRRLVIRPKHIFGLLLLFGAFFTAFQKGYFFLVTSEEFAIRTVRISCAYDPLATAVENLFQGRRLGNILLFDINALQERLQAIPWVKSVQVRKVFPSSLKVHVLERKPFALFEDGGLALIDEDGVVLEKDSSTSEWSLPIIRGKNAFLTGFSDHWGAVKSVIQNLPFREKIRLESLEYSELGDITLLFQDDPVKILVEETSVAEKLALFRSYRPAWESRFGPLSIADLRFSGRVIIRPIEQAQELPSGSPDKEVE
jgi:cell division septal protein FtsQ